MKFVNVWILVDADGARRGAPAQLQPTLPPKTSQPLSLAIMLSAAYTFPRIKEQDCIYDRTVTLAC